MWLGGSNSSDEQLIVPSLYRSGVRPNSGADHPSTLPIPTLVRPTAITYSSAFEDTDYRAANGRAQAAAQIRFSGLRRAASTSPDAGFARARLTERARSL